MKAVVIYYDSNPGKMLVKGVTDNGEITTKLPHGLEPADLDLTEDDNIQGIVEVPEDQEKVWIVFDMWEGHPIVLLSEPGSEHEVIDTWQVVGLPE